MGNLVFQATLGGQVNLVGPNTASTFNLNVPAVSSTIATTSGTETLTNKTLTTPVINGFTGDTSVVNIGSGQFYKDTSGNIGIGVTPSAWSGVGSTLQVGTSAAIIGNSVNSSSFISNAYYDGSNYKYIGTGYAARLALTSGAYAFQTAASGTAGAAISFTQAMTLDASGNLLVNTTTAREKITVNGSIAASGQLIPYSGSTSLGYIGNDSSISGGSGSNIGLRSEAAMLFATGGSTERARIDSSGNLLVGTTTFSNDVTTSGVRMSSIGKSIFTVNGDASQNLVLANYSSTGSQTAIEFYRNSSVVGSIVKSAGATAYNTSSDYRLKENIVPMTGALAKVAALRPCTYTWKEDGSEGEGFIAHELAEICPHAVAGEKDAVNEDGSIKPQGIDTSFLVATLTAAIQELNAKFEAYKAAHP